MTETKIVLTPEITVALKKSIERHRDEEGALMGVLHEAQGLMGHIPYGAQKFIAESLDIPLSEVYGVVTFYSAFTTEPVGKNKVSVCLGTACYVKGADRILSEVCKCLELEEGTTSADGEFSITATRCVGACGLAPIMTVNDDVYGKLDPADVPGILSKYKV